MQLFLSNFHIRTYFLVTSRDFLFFVKEKFLKFSYKTYRKLHCYTFGTRAAYAPANFDTKWKIYYESWSSFRSCMTRILWETSSMNWLVLLPDCWRCPGEDNGRGCKRVVAAATDSVDSRVFLSAKKSTRKSGILCSIVSSDSATFVTCSQLQR